MDFHRFFHGSSPPAPAFASVQAGDLAQGVVPRAADVLARPKWGRAKDSVGSMDWFKPEKRNRKPWSVNVFF